MKRKIDEKKYKEIAAIRQNALDWPQVQRQGLLSENASWALVCVPDKYAYTEYDNEPVYRHYLLIPKTNYTQYFFELNNTQLSDLVIILEKINDKFSGRKVIHAWKKGGSIRKLHIHIILL